MLKTFQNSPASKLLSMVGAANFAAVAIQISQNKKESNNNNLIDQLLALLDLVNNILIVIGQVKPIDAPTFRSNTAVIKRATDNLSNSAFYQDQCNIIVNLGNSLEETPNDKLLQLISIIITECQRLNNSINQQIQSLKR